MSEFNLRSNWTPLVLILIIISIISSIGFIATYFSLLSLISELENTEDSRIRAIEQLNVAIGVKRGRHVITTHALPINGLASLGLQARQDAAIVGQQRTAGINRPMSYASISFLECGTQRRVISRSRPYERVIATS